jgi:SPP1 gp7 family putative phage head morphogenesis protein
MTIRIPAQHLKPSYYDPIEVQLMEIFYDLLFKPLVIIVQEANAQISPSAKALSNASENALQAALRSGRVQYEAGVFSGQFSVAIAGALRSIGARFDRQSKVYRMDPVQVPGWVKAEASIYQQTARGTHDTMKRRLDEIQRDLDSLVDTKTIRSKQTFDAIHKDFREVAAQIQLAPQLSETSASELVKDYNENLKLYIRKFSREMITDLRSAVEQNAQQGYRFDKLVDSIKGRYAVSQNKAAFLARQETALFMSKYRRERFSEAGVTRYRWSTSHDERVRPSPGTKGIARANNHRILDGHIFEYANPPIVQTMPEVRRANPGEDFNCRCVDIPILTPMAVAA